MTPQIITFGGSSVHLDTACSIAQQKANTWLEAAMKEGKLARVVTMTTNHYQERDTSEHTTWVTIITLLVDNLTSIG